jgi:vacuolar-type H+-ATPase subunit I/STV1
MSSQNPYTPPSARVADVGDGDRESIESLNRIARGQRQVMFALLAQIAASIIVRASPQIGLLLLIAAFIFSVVALVRLTSALGISIVSRVLLCLGLLIPLVSLLVLAVLSSRASRRLRAAGFRIGFLGAKPREA